MNKKIIKTVLSNVVVIVVGLSLGYGSILGYKYFTEPKTIMLGDFSEHFKNTDKKVIMYGVDWCPICKTARTYFDENSIDYLELNPEKNATAYKMYKKLDINGYPVIIIENKRIFGFNIIEIEKSLNEL